MTPMKRDTVTTQANPERDIYDGTLNPDYDPTLDLHVTLFGRLDRPGTIRPNLTATRLG